MLGLAKFKRARFLLASTSEVYGDPQVHPQSEDYWGHVNPIGPRGVYDEAGATPRRSRWPTTASRASTPASRGLQHLRRADAPHDGRAVPTFLRQALQDKPVTVFGDGNQTRSFCYVDDLIRGLVALAESEVHPPVNLGSPDEFTLLELARDGDRSDRVALRGCLRALPTDDPQVRQPDITRARQLLDWEPESRTARRLAAHRSSRPASSVSSARAIGRSGDQGALRVAHLTATFPPYPGGAGNTAFQFARRQADRGTGGGVHRPGGRRAIPRRATVHRIEPALAIGNAPLILASPGSKGSTSCICTTRSSSGRS